MFTLANLKQINKMMLCSPLELWCFLHQCQMEEITNKRLWTSAFRFKPVKTEEQVSHLHQWNGSAQVMNTVAHFELCLCRSLNILYFWSMTQAIWRCHIGLWENRYEDVFLCRPAPLLDSPGEVERQFIHRLPALPNSLPPTVQTPPASFSVRCLSARQVFLIAWLSAAL